MEKERSREIKVKKAEKEAEERNGRDYNEYKMSIAEYVLYTLAAAAVLFAVGWIF